MLVKALRKMFDTRALAVRLTQFAGQSWARDHEEILSLYFDLKSEILDLSMKLF